MIYIRHDLCVQALPQDRIHTRDAQHPRKSHNYNIILNAV